MGTVVGRKRDGLPGRLIPCSCWLGREFGLGAPVRLATVFIAVLVAFLAVAAANGEPLETSDAAKLEREEASRGLTRKERATVVRALERVKDGTLKSTTMATYEIKSVGRAAVPMLIDALKDEDTNVSVFVITNLGHLGDPSAVPALMESLKDEDYVDRMYTAYALANLDASSAIPELIPLLRDDNGRVRTCVAVSLNCLDAKTAIPELVDLLYDDYRPARGAALNALADFGEKWVAPAIILLLNDEDPRVRQHSYSALVRLTDYKLGYGQERWRLWWQNHRTYIENAKDRKFAIPVSHGVLYASGDAKP